MKFYEVRENYYYNAYFLHNRVLEKSIAWLKACKKNSAFLCFVVFRF